MKELVLYIAQSLDGYIARKDQSIDWLLEYDDPTVSERYNQFIEQIDTIIMGYSTYRQLIEELSIDNWPYNDLNVFVFNVQPGYQINYLTGVGQKS